MKVRRAVVYGEKAASYPELCAGARELADEVVAVLVGDADAAASVASLGVEVRHVPYDGTRVLDDYWPVVAAVVAGLEAPLVLVRASKRARALAGQLAVTLGAVVASDATCLSVGDAGIGFQVVRYGGATVQRGCTSGPLVALVGPGLCAPASPAPGGSVMVVEDVVPTSGLTLRSRSPKAEQQVDLTAASVVIGVGRGIGSVENVGVAAEVAKAIGAELACSRPIAEGVGWLPKNRYLGVSGAVIQPAVYVALGISGQVQHMVGVNGATTIVAINKDKSAPIFSHCDLGLVADLSAVLPTLADQLS